MLVGLTCNGGGVWKAKFEEEGLRVVLVLGDEVFKTTKQREEEERESISQNVVCEPIA